MRKLTITVSDDVYTGLRAKIGPRRISHFLDSLARPHVVNTDLESAYAAMAADQQREAEALEWAKTLLAIAPMKRGEVWWVSFEPSVGGEIRKTRPAVIVSNDVANRNLNRLQVVPLSSKIEKLYPSETYVSVGSETSKAMADQLATVSKQRLRTRAGVLSPEDIADVERIIKVQLGLR